MLRIPATRIKIFLSVFLGILTVLISSCNRPEVIHDLSGSSYDLLNEDSVSVEYPADFRGNIQVIAFMFTHCPDICPAITANMRNIQDHLNNTEDISFLEITFDPERDTPSVLKKYKNTFELDDQFTLLTGDTATVNSVLDEFDIFAEKTQSDSLMDDSGMYNMKHTNRILVMDKQGRVRFEYPGSYVRPEHVVEDIQKLQ